MPDAPMASACPTTWKAPEGCTATDFEGKLGCIPDLKIVSRTDAPLPGYVRYDLTIAQPIDHDHPELGTFPQRLMLMHTSVDRPMVLATSGYNLSSRSRLEEVAARFAANELWYEHRYFVSSTPSEPADWSKLDIRQAAADAHHITLALHWLYPNAWANTGASKGGMTSVYQRRFHPCDVDATVAYVAPTTHGLADTSYQDFLSKVGGPDRAACRASIAGLQRRLLERRNEIVPLVDGTFTRIPADQAYELAVVELPFAFWQYTSPDDPVVGCAAIPPTTATADDLLAFLEYHSSPSVLASDASLALYRAYYHQSAAQLGFPSLDEAALKDLLRFPGTDVPATFLPAGTAPPFDAAAMPDIEQWVTTSGSQLLFVYGEFDPWSTRVFAPTAGNDAYAYVAPGGDHGAKISSLAADDQRAALDALSRWLGEAPVAARRAAQLRADDDTSRPPR